MRIKILVAAHKAFPMPDDHDLYLPVLVGAVRNANPAISYQRDDEGLNISAKNPNYNELTALYWAWKNLRNVDAIGLVHYRRYFLKAHGKRELTNILTNKDVENNLAQADVIVPKKRRYYIETNYSHYVHAHHQEPLDLTRKVIVSQYPSYLEAFDNVMNQRSAHMFNMMIMKQPYFDQYCEWLFAVLGQVEERLDLTSYSVQEKRVFGYLSELLLDVWLTKNQIKYQEVRWGQLGSQHLIKKMSFFVLRKLGIKEKTHF